MIVSYHSFSSADLFGTDNAVTQIMLSSLLCKHNATIPELHHINAFKVLLFPFDAAITRPMSQCF